MMAKPLKAVSSVLSLATALLHWGSGPTGALPLRCAGSTGLSCTHHFSTPHPVAMSWRNARGWMMAAEDGVFRADADNLPTGEREAKWQNCQGVLTFSSSLSSTRADAFRWVLPFSNRFYPLKLTILCELGLNLLMREGGFSCVSDQKDAQWRDTSSLACFF